MTESAERSVLLVNILRTLPYTAYVSSFSLGVLFPESQGLKVFGFLMANEASNHALKLIIKSIFGVNSVTARPKGAKDCGIYPQRDPRPSGSSGMPSGHSQTMSYLCYLLLRRAQPGWMGCSYIGTACIKSTSAMYILFPS